MKGVLVSAVLLMLCVACASTRKAPAPSNLEGNWKLAFFPYRGKTMAEVFGTRTATLAFNPSEKQISGTTGCNRYRGTFTASGSMVQFSQNRALTRMACGDYNESLFLNAFDRVNAYRLIEGQLELMQDTTIVMIFARDE